MNASLPWLTADEAAEALEYALQIQKGNTPALVRLRPLFVKLVQALLTEQSEVSRLFHLLEAVDTPAKP